MKYTDEDSIKMFKDEYSFLSNFYPHPIEYKGIEYPSSEHAYVSAKSNDPDFKLKISRTDSPGVVKRMGRDIEVIENWNSIRLSIMEEILRIKFSDEVLRDKLISTSGRGIYEGNWWNDKFWGVDYNTGCGQNNLGIILMKIRSEMMYKSIL